ncbi:MAG: SEL1-like repeat protein [Muribaculaceae bacterium]
MTYSEKTHKPLPESIRKAACHLCDYYWVLIDPEKPTDDPRLAARLFRWTRAAVGSEPDEYTYRLATLYTCGVGCEKDTDKAIDLYEEAYVNGDWRAAQAIAAMLADFLDSNPGLPDNEQKDIETEIERWATWAEDMRCPRADE